MFDPLELKVTPFTDINLTQVLRGTCRSCVILSFLVTFMFSFNIWKIEEMFMPKQLSKIELTRLPGGNNYIILPLVEK